MASSPGPRDGERLSPGSRCVPSSFSLFLLAALAPPALGATPPPDLAELPLEQLLTLEVVSASKFPQKLTQAPASVSVVTADEIRDYGHRSLADILRSIRGLYVSYDRNYSYLGVRGFSRPGDYNGRILLLVDGYRFNDNIYDQAAIGSEFPIDVDLIERVEFVPGPGASIYGSNAFFGVINVVTRRGADLGGAEVSGAAGSHGAAAGRASYGRRLDNGAELLVSASRQDSRGPDHFYPEFVAAGVADGMARGLDFDRSRQFFARLAYAGWVLQAVHAERTKGIPTASYGTAPGQPGTQTTDGSTYADLRYHAVLGAHSDFTGRVFHGRYDYEGDYVYDGPPLYTNKDAARGAWWGAEAKLVSTAWQGHTLVFGAEYQEDYRQEQTNYDEQPYALNLDDRRRGHRAGVFVQDEIALREDLRLNAGVRYDRNSTSGGIFNPRLALIWRALERTHVKLLYGTAYRAPNAYELYYAFPGPDGQKGNPSLAPERIRTYEVALEHSLGAGLRLAASLFHYEVRDLIGQTLDPADGLLVFRNQARAEADGAAIELERAWSGGARLRASYNRQRAEDDTGARLTNSPGQLAKINFSAPLPAGRLRAGAELQYTGARRTLAGEAAGYWVGNLNLTATGLAPGLEASLGIYNLFDRQYDDPGGAEHLQDAIRQDGRSVRAKLTYRF